MSVVINGNLDGNSVYIHPSWERANINISLIGFGNTISLRKPRHVKIGAKFNINISGNSSLFISEDCYIGSIRINLRDRGTLHIGGRVSVTGALDINLHEPSNIEIGSGCLIASRVWMSTSDMHGIFELASGERINHAADISIGNDVWIGLEARILKGASVGNGSVIGACSVVKSRIPENVIAAGNPAKVIREGIRWSHDLISD